MPFAPKMHVFEREIGGDQNLMPARDLQHSGIVAYACHDCRPWGGDLPNAPDQLPLALWHAITITPDFNPALSPGAEMPVTCILTAVIWPDGRGHVTLPW